MTFKMKEEIKFVLPFVIIRFRKSFLLLSGPEHFFASSLDALTVSSDSGAFR